MKLLTKIYRKLNREVAGVKYYKYLIPISNKQMEELGWNENTQVATTVKNKKIIVEKE